MNAIVIDKNGHKVELVTVEQPGNSIMFYEIQPSEKLIYDDIGTAITMLKPRWVDDAWVETATSEEIAERKRRFEVPEGVTG